MRAGMAAWRVGAGAGEIVGRDAELDRISSFLGESAGPAALLIEGPPGIGKSTLWQAAVDAAETRALRILRCRSAEAEMQLPYAALGDLLEDDVEGALSELPDPQRRALRVALLLAEPEGSAADPRGVGLALLGLLRLFDRSGAALVALDETQWLDPDSARVLAFALRRLRHERILVLAARRQGGGAVDRLDLPSALPEPRVRRLTLGPLGEAEIARLLRLRLGLNLSPPVLRRVLEDSGGNPMFALEIGRALVRAGGRVEAGRPLPTPADLRDALRRRLDELPQAVRSTLLVVALSARPTVDLIASAGEDPAAAMEDLELSAGAGVVEVRGREVRFTHPLLGSALQAAATPELQRGVHERLAAVVGDAEQRARHLALGTDRPDDATARALEEAAGRARIRGAPDAAAELLELAADLTPRDDPTERRRRHMAAARCHFDAGDVQRSTAILEGMRSELPPGLERARVGYQLAEAAPNDIARITDLMRQVLAEPGIDPAVEGRAHDLMAWCQIEGGTMTEARHHARAAVRIAEDREDLELLALALSTLGVVEFLSGRAWRGIAERAVTAQDDLGRFPTFESPRSLFGWELAVSGELDDGRTVLTGEADRLRQEGQVTLLSAHLRFLGELECRAGDWAAAERHAEEAEEITTQAELPGYRADLLALMARLDALRGRVEQARARADESLRTADRFRYRIGVVRARSVLGFLEISLGHASAAHEAMEPLEGMLQVAGVEEPGLFPFVPDEVEALTALGRVEEGAALTERLEERGRALGRPLALATAARCRGLVAASSGDLEQARLQLEGAVDLHEGVGQPFELARTLLLLGDVLRRARERRAARGRLTHALEIFETLGAPLWAERTRGALGRIGGRPGDPETERLSGREVEVLRQLARGLTNQQIAHALFLSVRTVERHISNIYAKLGATGKAARAVATDFANRHGLV